MATVALYNTHNGRIGSYCQRHGEQALKRHQEQFEGGMERARMKPLKTWRWLWHPESPGMRVHVRVWRWSRREIATLNQTLKYRHSQRVEGAEEIAQLEKAFHQPAYKPEPPRRT
jgi:hypothetical protein